MSSSGRWKSKSDSSKPQFYRAAWKAAYIGDVGRRVLALKIPMNKIRILGIESSCDETAAAVVADGARILSSVVSSQIATHAKYGGVVPELASREHLRAIVPAVRLALEQAETKPGELCGIAVTQGPGLVGSLLVGMTYAKALAAVHKLPLIAVNHIEGHIHAVVSQHLLGDSPVTFPALALVVSGGHTHLYEVREGFRYRLLGRTRDDAAGEAFDKVAKLLGFGYPGGPVIDLLAPSGNPEAVRFTLARMKGNALDFSFSGIKTAVLRWVQARDMDAEIAARRDLVGRVHRPSREQWLELTPPATLGYPVYFPEPGLSTDNAAMIAAAAFPKYARGEFADAALKADANLALA